MSNLQRVIRSPQDRFAQDVLAALRQIDTVTSCWLDKEHFALGYRLRGESIPSQINLDNAYRECIEVDPQERTSRIASLVATVTDAPIPTEWAAVKDELRPVVRPVTYGRTLGKTPIYRAALPFLGEFVVVDRPSSMATVTLELVRQWGVSTDEVFATARANMAATVAETLHPNEVSPQIRFLDGGDSYFSSLVLIDGWLAELGRQLGGRAIAFLADQNAMVVTDDDPDALAALLPLMEVEYLEAVRHISPVPYTTDDTGRVIPYTPPAEHPAAALVQRARSILAVQTYRGQTERLMQDLTPIFPAGLHMFDSGGRSFTVANWGQPNVLLPQADYVYLMWKEGRPVLIPWDIIVAETGLTASSDEDPPRFLALEQPDQSTIDRLLPHAVDLP